MPPVLYAIRPILIDLAATFLFYGLLAATGNVVIATAAGMAFGLAQAVVWKLRRRPISAMQWASLGLVVVMGGATIATRDARFILIKPTIIYAVIGAAMLQPGWMLRYMPPIALENVPRKFLIGGGYVWAGLMFFSAVLNLTLALTLPAQKVAALMAIWSPASKFGLLALHIATFKVIGRRTARMRAQSAQAQVPAQAAA
jgi:intracellular septation protein A